LPLWCAVIGLASQIIGWGTTYYGLGALSAIAAGPDDRRHWSSAPSSLPSWSVALLRGRAAARSVTGWVHGTGFPWRFVIALRSLAIMTYLAHRYPP